MPTPFLSSSYPSSLLPFCSNPPYPHKLTLPTDPSRRLVQTDRRKRARRRLPARREQPLPRLPVREPPPRAVRGRGEGVEPRRCGEGAERGGECGVEHGVSGWFI